MVMNNNRSSISASNSFNRGINVWVCCGSRQVGSSMRCLKLRRGARCSSKNRRQTLMELARYDAITWNSGAQRSHTQLVLNQQAVSSSASPSKGSKKRKEEVGVRVLPCRTGQVVKIRRKKSSEESVKIQIDVQGLTAGQHADLIWGMYRSTPDAWQYPSSVVPPGSAMDESLNAMRSPMKKSDTSYGIELSVPNTIGMASFAFVIAVSESVDGNKIEHLALPMTTNCFVEPIGYESGTASPIGPSLYHGMSDKGKTGKKSTASPCLVNFAVHARGCSYVSLVLVQGIGEDGASDSKTETIEIALDPMGNRTGSVWHIAVPCSSDLVAYGWRVDGDLSWEKGSRISPEKILLDPEAPIVIYADAQDALPLPMVEVAGEKKNALSACHIPSLQKSPDTAVHSSRNKKHVSSIMSIDIAEFGFDMENIEHPGTYQAVSEAVLQIKSLGIDAVLIRNLFPKRTHNGAAISLFAADPTLSRSSSCIDTVEEVKNMVKCLHEHDIDVYMTIDPTFTADGTDDIPHTISWRGFDYSGYYRSNGVLNFGSPVAQEFLIRLMRHWVLDYGIDGFEFIKAENLTQDADGIVMDAPALPDSLCYDPILSRVKLIASPNDMSLLPRGGARGFPHWGRWMETNVDTFSILKYFLTPPSSFNESILQEAVEYIRGRPSLMSSAHGEYPGNLSIGRPSSYAVNALNPEAWLGEDSLIQSVASTTRALVVSSGKDEFLPTDSSLTKAILLALLFSSGTANLPWQAIFSHADVQDLVSQANKIRKQIDSVLHSPVSETWYNTSGAPISLAFEGSAGPFLGRLVIGQCGSVYMALNPEPHSICIRLPHTNAPWLKVLDSISGDGKPVEVDIHGEYSLPSKAVAIFLALVS